MNLQGMRRGSSDSHCIRTNVRDERMRFMGPGGFLPKLPPALNRQKPIMQALFGERLRTVGHGESGRLEERPGSTSITLTLCCMTACLLMN